MVGTSESIPRETLISTHVGVHWDPTATRLTPRNSVCFGSESLLHLCDTFVRPHTEPPYQSDGIRDPNHPRQDGQYLQSGVGRYPEGRRENEPTESNNFSQVRNKPRSCAADGNPERTGVDISIVVSILKSPGPATYVRRCFPIHVFDLSNEGIFPPFQILKNDFRVVRGECEPESDDRCCGNKPEYDYRF